MKTKRMNYVVLLFVLFTFLLCGKMTVRAEDRTGVTYYVDAEEGNDNESGRSPEKAWKTDYYGAAEPPVRCGVSHLSGLTEPLH